MNIANRLTKVEHLIAEQAAAVARPKCPHCGRVNPIGGFAYMNADGTIEPLCHCGEVSPECRDDGTRGAICYIIWERGEPLPV